MTPRQTRLHEVEQLRSRLNTEFQELPAGHPRRCQILREMSDLGREQRKLGGRPGRG